MKRLSRVTLAVVAAAFGVAHSIAARGRAMFWELLSESVVTQSVLTLAAVGTACYLWCTGQPVPEALLYLVSSIVAFWMGTKTQHHVEKATRPKP